MEQEWALAEKQETVDVIVKKNVAKRKIIDRELNSMLRNTKTDYTTGGGNNVTVLVFRPTVLDCYLCYRGLS
ncbi:hypothetical protein DM860_011565 [Cuscuta australis]|uniref:Uncharacterized protein n=1 Tax=Cuscuta australis TaxID=267555 RepID=A0A328D3Y5_9ASTE|nr:hypothetical protein DM860_011565 [Cuscuta australis]